MKRTAFSLLLLIGVAASCSSSSSEETTENAFLQFPGIIFNEDGRVSLRTYSDSSYFLANFQTMMINMGNLSVYKPGQLLLTHCRELGAYHMAPVADSSASETLTITINRSGSEQMPEAFSAILFDSITYEFDNDQVVINKKALFESLKPAKSYEEFDATLLSRTMLKSGENVVFFYNPASLKAITLTPPSAEQMAKLGPPTPAGVLELVDGQPTLKTIEEEPKVLVTFTP